MQFFTVILALAATAFAAPNVLERQNQGCFEAGHVCISTTDCCNYQTGAGGSCTSAGVCS
ncbi:hypothetical protein Daus18300_007193 [Diaporthe australafricana]|uniref:Uncharacterized protein n=1 Tax=Diaporthe australafricana TaxID=127596 RepID=A0ABR3WP18_9PEZI